MTKSQREKQLRNRIKLASIVGISIITSISVYATQSPTEEEIPETTELVETAPPRLSTPVYVYYEGSATEEVIVDEVYEAGEQEGEEEVPTEPVFSVPHYDIGLDVGLQDYVYYRCEALGIVEHYELVLALIGVESNYNPNCVSRTNDYGLMQINKVNHKWLSKELGITDFLNPHQNIDAGTYMIASYLHKYGNEHRALMSYNFGEGTATKHWNRGTYSSSYSRKVIERKNSIINN